MDSERIPCLYVSGLQGKEPEVGNSTCLRQCFKQANIKIKVHCIEIPPACFGESSIHSGGTDEKGEDREKDKGNRH